MSKYPVVAALWEDHTEFHGVPLPDKLDELITPTLTIGFLYKETDRYLVIVSDVESTEWDINCNYLVILKSALVAPLKTYGDIKVKKLRHEEGS